MKHQTQLCWITSPCELCRQARAGMEGQASLVNPCGVTRRKDEGGGQACHCLLLFKIHIKADFSLLVASEGQKDTAGHRGVWFWWPCGETSLLLRNKGLGGENQQVFCEDMKEKVPGSEAGTLLHPSFPLHPMGRKGCSWLASGGVAEDAEWRRHHHCHTQGTSPLSYTVEHLQTRLWVLGAGKPGQSGSPWRAHEQRQPHKHELY